MEDFHLRLGTGFARRTGYPFPELVEEFLRPADETLVCRCEEVSAGEIRRFVALRYLGPNQTKAFGRPGMGPCRRRLCGLTVSELIAGERGVSPAEVGYQPTSVRTPARNASASS